MPANPQALTEEFLRLLGFDAKAEAHQFDDGILLDVQCDDAGRLIGRQGQVLGQLQYLINRMIYQADRDHPKVAIDVGGYRTKVREELTARAREAAEKVHRWGDVVELEPMNAFERYIIHHALKDDPTIETHSVEVDGTTQKAILLRPRH
ncbi:MAG: KH domain-containing protein [Bryobacter sp.]|jgi:spoIIIJ-associated protein|nr:KH domain-containing protein [Bryobacter sp.]